eukprot:3939676-Rhodomonas_salina.1
MRFSSTPKHASSCRAMPHILCSSGLQSRMHAHVALSEGPVARKLSKGMDIGDMGMGIGDVLAKPPARTTLSSAHWPLTKVTGSAQRHNNPTTRPAYRCMQQQTRPGPYPGRGCQFSWRGSCP